MDIFIYGHGECGRFVFKKIREHKKAQVNVLGWIDKNKKQEDTKLPCYTAEEFLRLNRMKKDVVLIASVNAVYVREMVMALRSGGYEDIYVFNSKTPILESEILDYDGKFSSSITHFRNIKPVMRYVDFMIAEHCNLNCRRCSFFSNIAKEKYADINSFCDAVNGLKKKFSGIEFFVLLGGEPLLNPELPEYIKIVRNAFPETSIKVTTNGLLVTSMSDQLIDALKRYRVILRISQYPPTTKIMPQIIDFLLKKGVTYFFTEPILSFDRFICNGTENPKVAYEANCSKVKCPEIYDNRLYNCSLIPAIYKNQQFLGFSISKKEMEQVSFDLIHGREDGWDILEIMNRPNKLCRYCTVPERMEWSNGGIPCKEDYIVESKILGN